MIGSHTAPRRGSSECELGRACGRDVNWAIFSADVCSQGSNGDIAEILTH